MEKKREKPRKRNYVYCALAILCIIAFIIWTGYWLTLLLIPLFIDIYITKFVPWGTWKQTKNKKLRVVLDWVDAIVFALVGVWFITFFFFQNYQIPSSSLEKSLLVGDYLCVSKLSYGARSPMTPFTLPLTQHTIPFLETKSYLEKPQLKYKRFKGTGTIQRSDIVVFNYPSGDTVALKRQDTDYYKICYNEGRDMIWNNPQIHGKIVYRPVDRRENYVKRCLGLPGETISLVNDSVFIDGTFIPGSENEQHLYVVQTDGTEITQEILEQLDISLDDRAYIGVMDQRGADSTIYSNLGLKMKGDNYGLCYSNVFLTKEKIEKLEAKSFVWTIMKQNLYLKTKGRMMNQKYTPLTYPITYKQEAEYGDFPALWIPKAGSTIQFDTDVDYKVAAYIRCIRNYEHNDFDYRDGKVYINGKESDSYTFKYDYYFMMGDNRDNSADSREWGFVPEDHIVGKPLFIWNSINKDKAWFDGHIRWNRLFTTGNKK